MKRTYNTVAKGRGGNKMKKEEVLPNGTVLYFVRIRGEDLWHTNAASALQMWEEHIAHVDDEDDCQLWQKVPGMVRRIR